MQQLPSSNGNGRHQRGLGLEPDALPHPVYHHLGPTNRASIQRWLAANEDHVLLALAAFVGLLLLAGLWRSRDGFVDAWGQWRRRRREGGRKRGEEGLVVRVGILRKRGEAGERSALLEGKRACSAAGTGAGERVEREVERVVKRVRFSEQQKRSEGEAEGEDGDERATPMIIVAGPGNAVVLDFRQEEEHRAREAPL